MIKLFCILIVITQAIYVLIHKTVYQQKLILPYDSKLLIIITLKHQEKKNITFCI